MAKQELSLTQAREATAKLLESDEVMEYLTADDLNMEAEEDTEFAVEGEGVQQTRIIHGHGLHVGYRNGKDTFEYWRGDSVTNGCGETKRRFIYQECWTYRRIGDCINGGVRTGHIQFTKRRACW